MFNRFENLTIGKLAIFFMIGVCVFFIYRNFSNTANMRETYRLLSTYKSAITLCILERGTAEGCDSNTQNIPADYSNMDGNVKRIHVKDGKIMVVSTAADKPVLITPNYERGHINWVSDNTTFSP